MLAMLDLADLVEIKRGEVRIKGTHNFVEGRLNLLENVSSPQAEQTFGVHQWRLCRDVVSVLRRDLGCVACPSTRVASSFGQLGLSCSRRVQP